MDNIFVGTKQKNKKKKKKRNDHSIPTSYIPNNTHLYS